MAAAERGREGVGGGEGREEMGEAQVGPVCQYKDFGFFSA